MEAWSVEDVAGDRGVPSYLQERSKRSRTRRRAAGGCGRSRSLRRGILIFDIEFVGLTSFDIKFVGLSKYDIGHANSFETEDFGVFSRFRDFH